MSRGTAHNLIITPLSLVTIKLIMGINLLTYARRRMEGMGMERRIREDEEVNFFGRPPVGEGKTEQVRSYVQVLLSVLFVCLFGRGRERNVQDRDREGRLRYLRRE